MIQGVMDGLKRPLNVVKVDNPPGAGIDFPLHMNFYPEGMTMKPGAFVIRGDIGQTVSRLEVELFENFQCPHVRYSSSTQPIDLLREHCTSSHKRVVLTTKARTLQEGVRLPIH